MNLTIEGNSTKIAITNDFGTWHASCKVSPTLTVMGYGPSKLHAVNSCVVAWLDRIYQEKRRVLDAVAAL